MGCSFGLFESWWYKKWNNNASAMRFFELVYMPELPVPGCVLYRVGHGSHVQRGTRNSGSMNRSSNAVCQVWWWKIYWCSDCWDEGKGPSDWLSHSWRPVHAYSCGSTGGLRNGFVWFSRGTSRSRASDRDLRHWDVSTVDTSYVVDAWSPPIFVHRVQTNEILLSMARHLGGSPRHHKVSRNASPITLTILVQPEKKQPVFWAHEQMWIIEFQRRLISTPCSAKCHSICISEIE